MTTTEPTSLPISQANRLLTTFTHFLTVNIHNILFYRGIYPEATFLTSRAYNLPVHQSRHPAVCAWIRDAVDAASAQLARGAVERIAIVIYDPSSSSSTSSSTAPRTKAASSATSPARGSKGSTRVLERWMFDVAGFPIWKQGSDPKSKEKEREAEAERDEDQDEEGEDLSGMGGGGDDGEVDPEAISKVNWTNIDEQLRAAIRRVAYAGEKMGPLPEGCTFTVAVELRDEAEAPIGHPQPWVPAQPTLQPASKDQRKPGADITGAKTTPIRAVEAGPLFFECWVEEGKAKTELTDSSPASPAK